MTIGCGGSCGHMSQILHCVYLGICNFVSGTGGRCVLFFQQMMSLGSRLGCFMFFIAFKRGTNFFFYYLSISKYTHTGKHMIFLQSWNQPMLFLPQATWSFQSVKPFVARGAGTFQLCLRSGCEFYSARIATMFGSHVQESLHDWVASFSGIVQKVLQSPFKQYASLVIVFKWLSKWTCSPQLIWGC